MPDLTTATALTADFLDRGLRRLAITFVNHAGSVLVKAVPLARLPLVARHGVGYSPVADAFGAVDQRKGHREGDAAQQQDGNQRAHVLAGAQIGREPQAFAQHDIEHAVWAAQAARQFVVCKRLGFWFWGWFGWSDRGWFGRCCRFVGAHEFRHLWMRAIRSG